VPDSTNSSISKPSTDLIKNGSNLQSIADFIRYTFSCLNREEVFCGHGTDNNWDEAVSLVLQLLELPWDFSNELWNCRLENNEKELLLDAIHRRTINREPLAYITKQAWFCGLRFNVDERVLIPRSPIGELIDHHIEPWLIDEPERILDLCTGSGCIGIAAALEFEDAQVDLFDISNDALDVARSNIETYKLNSRVQAFSSDVFSALDDPSQFSDGEHVRYDLILSNPPYVDKQDYESMPKEFSSEPVLGLVAGPDGLDIVRRILAEGAKHLSEDGLMIVEVGNSWEALEEAYPDFPFTWIEFEQGGHGVFVIRAHELRSYPWV
jgi:ribosomal protein L3 glutamine methyltransferase